MTGDVSLALAFLAGLLSFVSPCVLALVPVYLAFLGQAAGDAGEGGGRTAELTVPRTAVVPQAALFIIGFSAVFIIGGVSVGLLGMVLFRVNEVRQVVGIVVIAIGIGSMGWLDRFMARFRFGLDPSVLPVAGSARALGLGALVGLGWTPCIGATLGTILMMGASGQSAWAALLLLVAYSAGLAVPFMAAAVALPRMAPLLAFLRRHHRAVQVVTGAFIVAVGVLIYLNAFTRLAGLFTFVL